MEKIRILLADDHAVLRAGLRMLLNSQSEMEVVGEAADGDSAVARSLELKPDVVLMDLSMPGIGGIEATRCIREALPGTKVLILTMYDDEGYLNQVLRAGASGYVLKKAADTELLSAIRAVQSGEVFLYPSMAKMLVKQVLHRDQASRSDKGNYDVLSNREKEVLRLVALGHTNQQIANTLVLSAKTVETHRSRIMDKLKLRSRSELVRYAIERGLVDIE